MASVIVRDLPPEVHDALKAIAASQDQSLEAFLRDRLVELASPARRRQLFRGLDERLGNEPVLDIHPATAVREGRDERDARAAHRAGDYA